jgi:hypothetical protein
MVFLICRVVNNIFQLTITRLEMPVVIGATTLPKMPKGVLCNSGEKKETKTLSYGGLRFQAQLIKPKSTSHATHDVPRM